MENTIIDHLDYQGYRIEVHYDEDPLNPHTEYDNLGKLALFHHRYDLPNDSGLQTEDFDGWGSFEEGLRKRCRARLVLPVFAYIHSGIALSTGRQGCFSDPWDSGQLGFVYATASDIKKAFLARRADDVLDQAQKALEAEVETFGQYLNGSCYGWVVKDPQGEIVDSCWGIYLDDSGFKYLYDEARSVVDSAVAEKASLVAAAAEVGL